MKDASGYWRGLLLAALLLALLVVAPLKAAGQESAGAEIEATPERPRETLSAITEKMKTTEALIESSQAKEEALASDLKKSDEDLAALRKQAELAARRATANKAKARALQTEAASLSRDLARLKESLHAMLLRLYRQGSPSTAQVLLASPSLTADSQQATYTRLVARSEREGIARTREALGDLEARRQRLSSAAAREMKAHADADRRAALLGRQAKAKRELLASVQRERHLHEEAQREMEAAAKELKALIARLGEQWDAAVRPGPDGPGQSRLLPFGLMKGKLPWPLAGQLLKTPRREALLHKGLYIQATEGAPIEAVAAGTVVFADAFRGYGNLCIIDHGGSYHSLYAHAQELSVDVGDRVEAGQLIGRAGSKGSASSPRLYFELRHRGRPLNPLPWMVARSP